MRNPFATKARKLHRLISPKRNIANYTFEPEKVLEVLDSISIPEGKALGCSLVDFSRHCLGDNSFLYVSDCTAPTDETKFSFIDETWKNIKVQPCAMGMWQAYLLMTTIHIMPFYWHGGYNERIFIFSPADLKKIPEYKDLDFSRIDESKLQPEVTFTQWLDDECMGMVSCTYWTEWGGLVRETVIIDMYEDKITAYGPAFNEALLRYDSGCCY